MKLIIKIALGIILALLILVGIITCVGSCLDDDDEVQTEEYEEERTDDYYEDADEEDSADGTNIAPGEEVVSTSSSWGDGTCRSSNAKQFYQLVASKKQYDTYIGEGPCVVDFWADWCGYCKLIDPYMKALAKKYKGKVQFYKVNADENEELLQLYGIDGLPTLFFCHGEDIKTTSGASSQEEYEELVRELL